MLPVSCSCREIPLFDANISAFCITTAFASDLIMGPIWTAALADLRITPSTSKLSSGLEPTRCKSVGIAFWQELFTMLQVILQYEKTMRKSFMQTFCIEIRCLDRNWWQIGATNFIFMMSLYNRLHYRGTPIGLDTAVRLWKFWTRHSMRTL